MRLRPGAGILPDVMMRPVRYLPFAALYFAQGAVTAYLQSFHKIYLESEGVPNATIAALGAAFFLPFILKIFIAAGSDAIRHPFWGRRSLWIAAGLLTAAAGFAGAWGSPPGTRFASFALCTVLISLGLAITDAVADGLAVETTPPEDEGLIQSLMFIGRSLGVIAYAYGLGYAVHLHGYVGVYPALLLSLLPATLLLAALPRGSRTSNEGPRATATELSRFFFRGEPARFVAFAFLLSVLLFGSEGLFGLHMKNSFALAPERIARFVSLRGIGALVGAAAAGALCSRLRLALLARGAAFALAAGLATLALAPTGERFVRLAGAWGFVSGFASTVFVAAAMRLSLGAWPATVFAIFMALANVGAAVGDAGATRAIPALGFAPTFLALAGIGLFSMLLVPRFPEKPGKP